MNLATLPAKYDEAVLYAVRAFWDGKANAGQQILVRDWLMFEACRLRNLPFALGGEDGRRSSDFLMGRQFPAHELVRLTKPEALAALKSPKPRMSKAAVEKEAKE